MIYINTASHIINKHTKSPRRSRKSTTSTKSHRRQSIKSTKRKSTKSTADNPRPSPSEHAKEFKDRTKKGNMMVTDGEVHRM